MRHRHRTERTTEDINRELLTLVEDLAVECSQLPTRLVLDSFVRAVRMCRVADLPERDLPARAEKLTRDFLAAESRSGACGHGTGPGQARPTAADCQ